jgi:hypothetical protein
MMMIAPLSQSSTSETHVNAARVEELILEHQSNTWDAAISTVMSKWKWLFVNGGKCEPDYYQARIFIIMCQEGTNESMCFRITFKIIIIHQ